MSSQVDKGLASEANSDSDKTLFVGKTVTEERLVTQEDVNKYADLVGDHNPIHIDPEYAAKTPFGQTIAHGMFVGGFFSSLLATRLPGPGAIYMSQEMKFRAPVLVGHKVQIQLKVESMRDDKPILVIETLCLDLKGKVLVEGKATVLFRR